MNLRAQRRRHRIMRITAVALAMIVTVVIVWIDLATGVWKEAVILAGLAAGLMTFVLTSLVVERLIERGEHRAWYPVTRLALTDILHALADEEVSEISRGVIVSRPVRVPADLDPPAVDALLTELHRERGRVTTAFARWAGFLAASADVRELMIHIAELSERLDRLRDDALAAERDRVTPEARQRLRSHAEGYSASIANVVAEIQRVLAHMPSDLESAPAR